MTEPRTSRRGGARPGAGRKPKRATPAARTLTIRVSQHVVERLDQLGVPPTTGAQQVLEEWALSAPTSRDDATR